MDFGVIDDAFVVPVGSHVLQVLGNDNLVAGSRISRFTQPSVGSVDLVDDQLRLTLPDGATQTIEFEYTVETEGIEQTARVVVQTVSGVVVDHSAETEPFQEFGAVDAEVSEDRPTLSIQSVPPALRALVDLNLPLLRLLSALPFFLLAALLMRVWRRRRGYVAIDGVTRADSLPTVKATPFRFRHDTERVWRTGRRDRSGRVELLGPNGKGWVDQDRIVERTDGA